ncbi:MAG TPA: AAA family ATPase [Polyangiaceae bacterium]|nr:AAA family ATPase [Polyangiaceae bacterium]
MDAILSEALGRLDEWLIEVTSREERRAGKLVAADGSGWAGVRALARPSFAELALDDPSAAQPALIPEGDHPLARAQGLLGLDAPLAEALLVLLAPHLEPRYRALYAVLQDDNQSLGATERLLLCVLGRTRERRLALYEGLAETGRLAGSGMVVPLAGVFGPLGRPFDLAPEVKAALLGLRPTTSLAGAEWSPPLEARPARGEVRAAGAGAAVIFGAGEWQALARRLAADERGLLIARLGGDRDAAGRLALAAWRAATLAGGIAVLDLTDLDAGPDIAVAAEVLQKVEQFGGRVLLRARQELALPVPQHEAPAATYAERRRAWATAAMERGLALDEAAFGRLASHSRVSPEELAQVFGAANELTEAGLAQAAARRHHRPIRHGVRVPARRTLGDLVVRESTRRGLERLVYFVQNRDRIAEALGRGALSGQRRGPLVLFSGLSGTGKTLAAEAVAHSLARPLYVVDLSQLVSKYIGDTEKHIDQVLSEAERAGVVLFFDEADSMFASRTEQVSNANDRFANMSVGFLLHRIERHDGVVILATNLRHSIDAAFMRRFHFRLEFPFPEPAERQRIWQMVLPPALVERAGLDLGALAERHRLSGGEIRNVAEKAVFLAEQAGEPLDAGVIERAVALELFELGRLVRHARGLEAGPDTGAVLRHFTERLEAFIDERLRQRFTKEIHLVHGAPTREALSGRRPAVSLALYRIAHPRAAGLRLGFVISAWAQRTEDEHELLGAVHDALTQGSLGQLGDAKVSWRVQESYDSEMLHRFWSSHGHPMRAGVALDVEIG